ncbi:protein N-terminal asparagine amidohydrolase-like isoform X2 [Ptychodera flava]|uniref:protein N-terminal asparagine amidohydrolase-like isoform X2 n=1 Tax=Ptychodera flava TaxID=63121 RepID=UPI00396A1885
MPIIVRDQQLEKVGSISDFLGKYPFFKESALKLNSQTKREVGPKGLLYVCQREFATTSPEDASIEVMGSEDATTCHLTVLKHTGSGAVCVSHCDGSSVPEGVRDMIQEVTTLSQGKPGHLELHVVGGFLDDKKTSEGLFLNILNLNDVVKNGIHWPIIYGIGVDMKTGEIFPASFAEKGPDDVPRGARNMIGKNANMASMYDFKKRQLHIGPFQYAPWPDAKVWLKLPDDVILNNMSTSPKVEPPDFVAHMRAVLKHVIENPNPRKTLFPGGKPRLYEKDSSGLWVKVDS